MAYLTLLLAVLLVHKALCEATFWDTAVQFSETMTLECVYPLMDNLTQVEWNKISGPETVTIAVYIPNHRMHIHKNYLHRVHFPNSTLGFRNMSLSFYNASETDIGTYTCLLSIFPSGLWVKKIKVVQSDSFAIVTPSNGYLYAEPGQNVTLSCQLPRNWPVQQVMWERVEPHQVDILASCNLSQGTRYTSKYLRKTWSACRKETIQSVIIPNATAADSGLYRCRSEASTGTQETFVIRLIITDGGTNKHFILLIAGGSVSLLLIILIIIIIIFYNRRRRRQVRTPLKEPRDKQSKVATNCRSPTSPIHSIDDEKEDIYVNYPTFSRRPKPRF